MSFIKGDVQMSKFSALQANIMTPFKCTVGGPLRSRCKGYIDVTSVKLRLLTTWLLHPTPTVALNGVNRVGVDDP
jgi:hypothetical protein